MNNLKIANDALRTEIALLAAEQLRLRGILDELDRIADETSSVLTSGQRRDLAASFATIASKGSGRDIKAKTANPVVGRATKRKRLKPEVAKDISEKIVKAAKAHGRSGAARSDIVKYLDISGYRVDHHYTGPILGRMVKDLVAAGDLAKQGDKAAARYSAA